MAQEQNESIVSLPESVLVVEPLYCIEPNNVRLIFDKIRKYFGMYIRKLQ